MTPSIARLFKGVFKNFIGSAILNNFWSYFGQREGLANKSMIPGYPSASSMFLKHLIVGPDRQYTNSDSKYTEYNNLNDINITIYYLQMWRQWKQIRN